MGGTTVWTDDPIDATVATQNLVRSIAATDNLVQADNTKMLAITAAGGIVTLNLLASVAAGNGFSFSIRKDVSDNPVIVVPNGAETFWSGESSLYIGPSETIYFRCTGASWIYSGYPNDIGATKPLTHTTVPAGYLLEYGQAVSRTVYARYFALVGTRYGVGDGSTTFNVRDKRGRVGVGVDNMGGTAANISQVTSTLTTTSGSPTATVGSAAGLALGMVINSANVPLFTTITAISGATLTMSQNATATSGAVGARFSALTDAQIIGGYGGERTHTQVLAELISHHHADETIGTTQGATAGGVVLVATLGATVTGDTGGGLPMNVTQPSIAEYSIVRI